ncbi:MULTISPECIES: GntR family transcriptional regulator [Niallia]|jgi:GntR family transcriptional regulator|uniref:GntR family transcriptional regulator n=1 Tax=Niallia circulans TaxID=1397 RepID=A0A268F9J1_NIACI|nr:GntR family transcriptional regulator [Niallia circulans]AYV66772.1 GntR family transcriptional regulator [Niallia circulans]AYV70373.1 GntR family transcriptional regulator [Niallia circulans]NRG25907.1 GntR family transcriptional regulator [Niallia circulans]PAD82033.1 GntR family transcriptional regulator [Niallia circulans]QJX62670.1 GntR family transcriptional regulator [Niallia circulans]
MENLNITSSKPLYHQLAETIRKDIYEGKFKQDERIPSEFELSEMYEISRSTVRKAISILVEEDLLVKIHGKGTFVAAPMLEQNNRVFMSFTSNVETLGKTLTTKTQKVYYRKATEQEIEFFNLTEPEDILIIERLRIVDNLPIGIETVFFTKKFDSLKDENLNGSLYAVLEDKYSITPYTGSKTIEICYATLEESNLLDIPRGSALMLVKDKVYDTHNNPLHISKQVLRGDKFKYAIKKDN